MQLDKAFDGREKSVPQAALVGAASAGRNQIHIAFAYRLAVFGEGHAPVSALAFGIGLVRGIGKTLALKHRDDQIAVERLRQVVMQAAFVQPGLRFFGFFAG